MNRLDRSGSSGQELAAQAPDEDDYLEGIDVQALVARIRKHQVLLGGLGLIVVALLWRIVFLSHLYFRLDDFIDLDIAIQSPFNWKYLTYNGVGHLIIGVRALGWFLARTNLYNWDLDNAIDLLLVFLSSLAALRLLRSLFGDRLHILILLGIYLFCPLTMPGLGEWSSALEALPLQLALFMALDAQVRYVRTGRRRYFGHAMFWTVFGLLFFEKGLVLPPFLFACTSAFLVNGGSWLAGMRKTLTRYWQDWVAYLVVMLAYAYVLAQSLKTSRVQPSAPSSIGAVWHLSWGLVGKTFIPGAFGGPWRWFGGQTYALALAPGKMVVLSTVVAIGVVVVSCILKPKAWRAWAILAGWLLVADLLPIIVGRVNNYPLDLLASETRYVADAVPILVICVGLAFLPLADQVSGSHARQNFWQRDPRYSQIGQYAVGGLVMAFIFGSLWSVQTYENLTSSTTTKNYVHNAARALALVPTGTKIANLPAPPTIILNHNGTYVPVSQFIGDMQRDHLGHHVVWVARPSGTLDSLLVFGPNGRLYPAKVTGAKSVPAPAGARVRGCWPERHGTIAVRLASAPPFGSSALRIGYVWGTSASESITVRYGNVLQSLVVRHGLHAAFLPISGTASRIVISGFVNGDLCVGDVEVGTLAPNVNLPALPPLQRPS